MKFYEINCSLLKKKTTQRVIKKKKLLKELHMYIVEEKNLVNVTSES